MRFGPVPLEQAAGSILAHSANLRGGRLRKGKVLDTGDLARMAADGWQDVIVAQLDPGDLHEDAAAARLAAALVPDPAAVHLTCSLAATGRVNIHAVCAGIVQMNVAAIHAVNAINPMLTVATVPPFARVAAGDMVATIKVISYAVAETDVVRAEAAGRAGLALAPPVIRTATLIETQIGAGPVTKGRTALETRLARLHVELTSQVIVPHDEKPVAQAIADAPGDVIFVLTASATSDIADVAPAALRLAGGDVVHFGMPVDPGNLLFVGTWRHKSVIGLPGCARSPVLNGADWVLERVICGVPVTPADIAGMGVGGLLKEIPSRPRPRDISD